LFVYILAIANRTSFGVAGLVAAERFNTSATVLSLFVVVQLFVYAFMQLPAGMALDRWGARRLIITGAIAMTVGQLVMAFVPSVGLALGARVLIGAGDATIFVSAVRLVWEWFPAPRVPLLTQMTGLAGNIGQLISAYPFAAALAGVGWYFAFGGLAALTALTALVALLTIRQSTATAHGGASKSSFRAAVMNPATWLGFFTHMLCGLSATVFIMMWGVPFMRQGLGYGERETAFALTLVVLTALVVAPVIGQLTAKFPQRRTMTALIIGGLVCVGWAIMLVPTTPLPYWIFAVAIVLIAIGGPASLIGLDLAGSFNQPERRSTVQGIANMGGFVAAILVMLTVGVILDRRTGADSPALGDYRAALSVVFIPMILAALGVIVFRNKTRRSLTTETGF
jgi:MFS family permease